MTTTDTLMLRFLKWNLRNRVLVLVVFGVLSLLSVWSLSHAVIASSLGKLFLGESQKYKDYLERSARFSGDEIIIAAIEDPQFLEPEHQDKLQRVIDEIAKNPYVRRVDSVLKARYLREHNGFSLTYYAKEARKDPSSIPELIKALQNDPFAKGLFVSSDGHGTALAVELEPSKERTAEQGVVVVEQVKACFLEAGYKDSQCHFTGNQVIMAEVLYESIRNLTVLLPIVSVVLLITVWLLFRRLWPALFSLIVAFLAVLWTMALAVAYDHQVNIMMSAVPLVILIVAFSDIIHLCSAYLLELGDGLEKEQAILSAGEDVGRACLYTSLTTFVGFVCMSFVPTPVFRQLGIILGLGVGIALLQAMTLVPILFSYMSAPKPLPIGKDAVQNGLDSLLRSMRRVSLERPYLVFGSFCLITLLALVGSSQIVVETDLARRIATGNRARQDQMWFNERFSGANFLDIYLTLPSPKDLDDPEWIRRIDDFQRELEQDSRYDRALSFIDVLKFVRKVWSFGQDSAQLPQSQGELANLMAMIRSVRTDEAKRFFDGEKGEIRINLRLKNEGYRNATRAGERALSLVRKRMPECQAEATGLFFIMGDWLDEIIEGQKRGVLVSIGVITIMMVLCFRSLSVGLWSMLPNVLPLFVLGGWLGLTWDQVDSDTLTVGLLAIGIGVDDTIHFLSRYQSELRRNNDRKIALERTYDFAGRAILMTTLIFVAGNLPLAWSNYFSIQIFGTLLPMCFVVAVIADLMLVPAMAQIGLLHFANVQAVEGEDGAENLAENGDEVSQ